MLGSNIYSIDWDKLIQWLLPIFLRKHIHWEWLRVNLFPLISLNNDFNVFRNEIAYSMSLSPQTIQLERLLNDRYDETLRRIFIRDGEFREGTYLYRYLENPNFVEDYPTSKFLQSIHEFNAPIDVHFYVVLPIGLLYNEDLMKSLITKYSAVGYTFKIIEE